MTLGRTIIPKERRNLYNRMKNIFEYLEENAVKHPCKMAYFDDEVCYTWEKIREFSYRISSGLIKELGLKDRKRPIALALKKSPIAVAALFAVMLSGRFYVFLDDNLPEERLETIIKIINPIKIIDDDYLKKLSEVETDVSLIKEAMSLFNPEDTAYITFTSSTTGAPKGVETSFSSAFRYIEGLIEALPFNKNTVTANQAPFYFDACLKDIYTALVTGGGSYLCKREFFSEPSKLIKALIKNGINTLTWTSSAYSIMETFNAFCGEDIKGWAESVRLITFGSEVMRAKTLNYLRKCFKNSKIFQLYGPTEATGMSTFYEVRKYFKDGERIPIGKPFSGVEIELSTDGEIVIKGNRLAKGYYKDKEKTEKVFKEYNGERAYFTGDLAYFNEDNDLIFLGRKDRVIKRAGYMMSLEYMELLAGEVGGVSGTAALYDESKDRITLFYEGEAEKEAIREFLGLKFPKGVLPGRIEKVKKIPKLANGKTDFGELRGL